MNDGAKAERHPVPLRMTTLLRSLSAAGLKTTHVSFCHWSIAQRISSTPPLPVRTKHGSSPLHTRQNMDQHHDIHGQNMDHHRYLCGQNMDQHHYIHGQNMDQHHYIHGQNMDQHHYIHRQNMDHHHNIHRQNVDQPLPTQTKHGSSPQHTQTKRGSATTYTDKTWIITSFCLHLLVACSKSD